MRKNTGGTGPRSNKVANTYYASRGRKAPPKPPPRPLTWTPPTTGWAGEWVNLEAWGVEAGGSLDDVWTDVKRLSRPNGGKPGQPLNQEVTLKAKAREGENESFNSKTAIVAVNRRPRTVLWNPRTVWEVGESLTFHNTGASCPDGGTVRFEPDGAFDKAGKAVKIAAVIDGNDFYWGDRKEATVQVVADIKAHAESVGRSGMLDGSIWDGTNKNDAKIYLDKWAKDEGGVKQLGQEIMGKVKDMAPGELIDYMDKTAKKENAGKEKGEYFKRIKPGKDGENNIWIFPNGLMVRYKPKGDKFGDNYGRPMFCVEMRTCTGFTDEGGAGQNQVAFKLSDGGEPTSRGGGTITTPSWVTSAGLASDFTNSACSVNHLRCKVKTAQVMTLAPTKTKITYGEALDENTLKVNRTVGDGALTFTLDDVEVKSGDKPESIGTGKKLAVVAAATETYDLKRLDPVDIEVARAPAVITWPLDDITIECGQTLDAYLNATATENPQIAYTLAGKSIKAGDKPVAGDAMKLVASAPETAHYLAGTATRTVTVKRLSQVITWGTDPIIVPYGTKLDDFPKPTGLETPGFTYTLDGKAIQPSQKPNVCMDVDLVATAAQTESYLTATATRKVTVQPAEQVITWDTSPIVVTAGDTLQKFLNPEGFESPDFTYTIDGKTLQPGQKPDGCEDADLIATAAPTTNYTGATASRKVTVKRAPQTITWDTGAISVEYGTKLDEFLKPAGLETPAFSFTLDGKAIVPGDTPESCTDVDLVATASETKNYLGAKATRKVTIRPAAQVITWDADDIEIEQGATLDEFLNPTAGMEAPTFSFTLDGKPLVPGDKPAPCENVDLVAIAAPTKNHLGATASRKVTVRAPTESEQEPTESEQTK